MIINSKNGRGLFGFEPVLILKILNSNGSKIRPNNVQVPLDSIEEKGKEIVKTDQSYVYSKYQKVII